MLFFKKPFGKTENIEKIPGIEQSGIQAIKELGFSKVSELYKCDAEELYYTLCLANNALTDKSVLFQLRCAIYYATVKTADPKKLHWWYWKDSDANDSLLSEEDLIQIYTQNDMKGV